VDRVVRSTSKSRTSTAVVDGVQERGDSRAGALERLLRLDASVLEQGLDIRHTPGLAPLVEIARVRGPRLSYRDLRRLAQRLADQAMALRAEATLRRGLHPDEFELVAAVAVARFALTRVQGSRERAVRLEMCFDIWRIGLLHGVVDDPVRRWDGAWSLPFLELESMHTYVLTHAERAALAAIKPRDSADLRGSGRRRKHYDKCMRRALPRILRGLDAE
jgi:hypothetical protein